MVVFAYVYTHSFVVEIRLSFLNPRWAVELNSLHRHAHTGVLDGEVVAVNMTNGEHEAFGHNKTVAINKAVRTTCLA